MKLSAAQVAAVLAGADRINGAPVPAPGGSPVRLTLPMPPTTNHYWRHVIIKGKPRIVLGTAGKRYREDCRRDVWRQHSPTVAGRCAVAVTVYPNTRRRFDLDNRLKPLLDALVAAGVIGDDHLIDRLTITRGPVHPAERAEVVVSALTETPDA